MEIGKLEKIPVTDLWRGEKSFTSWLSKNLELVGEELGIKINSVETEKNVGKFYCDILAEDQNGDYITIECQFDETDHDHLGKTITYLSGLNAKTAIWICEEPRQEHQTAINWLNSTTPVDVSFYLLAIEAIRTGEEKGAPLFKVVCSPSEEQKVMGKKKEELAERHIQRREFWTQLLDKSNRKMELFTHVSPSKDNWIAAGAGKSGINFSYQINMDCAHVYSYIDRGKGFDNINQKWYNQIYSKKSEIERAYGGKLNWVSEAGRRSKLISVKVSDKGLKDTDM